MQGPYLLAPSITFHLPIYITLALSRLLRLYLSSLSPIPLSITLILSEQNMFTADPEMNIH